MEGCLFTASASILEIHLKDTNKRARNMKFTSIFLQRVQNIFEVLLKKTNKRAKYKSQRAKV